MSNLKHKPKLDSLFRVQTLLILSSDKPKSGYDIAKELEKITGKKPSSGKIYPFLHELRDNGFIKEIEPNKKSGRGKTSYKLTDSGVVLVSDLMERMGSLIDARLDDLLETCYHCGVQIKDSKISKEIGGKTRYFCCEHCMGSFIHKEH